MKWKEVQVGLIIFLLGVQWLYAQKPFDCSGRMYRVIERNGGSAFEAITIDKNQEPAITFEELAFFEQKQLNGICYNPTDDFIYGLELGDEYRLIRIDANTELTILKTLSLPTSFTFVSGDISPDGRYLMLLGYSPKEEHNIFVKVDLSQKNYPEEQMVFTTTGGVSSIFCADIAFHPTTHILYGFDHREGRLVTIDVDKQLIDNASFPVLDNVTGNAPSLFFDAFGNLFGIAVPYTLFPNRKLYQFDLANGNARELAMLGIEQNQDACSCPYEVNLYQEVAKRTAYPCTEITFTLRLVNRSSFVQTNLRLRDTLQAGLVIEQILHNPFSGRLLSGEGTNILALDGFDLSIGTDSVVMRVAVPEGMTKGIFESQAYLYNVNHALEGANHLRLSDDPETPVPNDPTKYEIRDLEILFADDFPVLCKGSELELGVELEGAIAYQWSNGKSGPTVTVHQPGMYEVTVSTACGTAVGAIFVEEDRINLRVDHPVVEAERGSRVHLSVKVENSFSNSSVLWKAFNNAPSPDCLTCQEVEVMATKDGTYGIEAYNENGCRVDGQIQIETVGFKYFAPTAFSPDGNGQNEHFYLYGKFDFEILQFSVYNRWGGRVFHREQGKANDPAFSWDGFYDGKVANAGTYLWAAQVKSGNGIIKNLSGEVNLIR